MLKQVLYHTATGVLNGEDKAGIICFKHTGRPCPDLSHPLRPNLVTVRMP